MMSIFWFQPSMIAVNRCCLTIAYKKARLRGLLRMSLDCIGQSET